MFSGKQLDQGIKQVCFVLILIGLFAVIIKELNYFLSSILGAFTLYMLLRRPHRKLLAKGWNKTLATSCLLMLTILVVFVVGGVLFSAVYSEMKDFQPQIVIDNFNSMHDMILAKTGYNIFSKNIVDEAIRSLSNFLPDIFSTTGSILTNGLMMIFVLFFMLQESQEMESSIERRLPLSASSISMLKKETQSMVVSNAIGIPVILIGQAIFAGLGYWIFGAGDPMVWGLLTGVFGLLPIIGTAGIWLPLSINLLLDGYVFQGILLIIYGAVVISSIDNVIRIVFLKRYANVHPLVTIFGIILGMNLFGFWGIIFGPLMISGFVVLCKIYQSEFLKN